MSLDRTIQLLESHALFAALPPEALRILAFSSDRLELIAGQKLFHQGAPADNAFIVARGTLEIEVTIGGATTSAGTVDEGALVGEIALLSQTTRPGTAIARAPVEVVRVPRAVFRRLLEEYPQGAQELRRRLGERLMSLNLELDKVRVSLTDGVERNEA